jgi:hypothetical protein
MLHNKAELKENITNSFKILIQTTNVGYHNNWIDNVQRIEATRILAHKKT